MTLPPLGEFAVGMIFVNAKDKVEEVMKAFEGYANECEMKVAKNAPQKCPSSFPLLMPEFLPLLIDSLLAQGRRE